MGINIIIFLLNAIINIILAALMGTLAGTIELMLIGNLASNLWAMFCNLIAWAVIIIIIAMHFGIPSAIIFGVSFILSMVVITVEKEKEKIAIQKKLDMDKSRSYLS